MFLGFPPLLQAQNGNILTVTFLQSMSLCMRKKRFQEHLVMVWFPAAKQWEWWMCVGGSLLGLATNVISGHRVPCDWKLKITLQAMDSVLDSSYHQLVIFFFLCVKGYCVQDYFPTWWKCHCSYAGTCSAVTKQQIHIVRYLRKQPNAAGFIDGI